MEIPVDAVVFRADLYPRIEPSHETVQRYAENLEVLPPIEVNQHNELIDGWNRWTAHKKKRRETICAFVTQTASDIEVLELAIKRNASHGLQLSLADKKKQALRIYGMCAYRTQKDREEKKANLAKLLSVDDSTIRDWTSRTDKEVKAELRQKAFDLWLSCHTQAEIAEAIGYSRPHVAEFLKNSGFVGNGEDRVSDKADDFAAHASGDTADGSGDDSDESSGLGRFALSKEQIAESNHIIDFKQPLYNSWKQQEKTPGSKHFGNSEIRWVDNLLYLYTEPFDVVVDPFAGGGSTADVCRKRLRRYWVSDRKPIIEREHEIRRHDMTAGLPPIPRWKDVRLVYLDPPYWKQAEGKYSDDPSDLANMPLEEFTKTLAGIINSFAKKLSPGAVIAMLMQPTQWRAPEHQYTDHVADMIRLVKLPIDMRVQCPYESQQYTPQAVDWAKENKKILVLSRELVIWRVE